MTRRNRPLSFPSIPGIPGIPGMLFLLFLLFLLASCGRDRDEEARLSDGGLKSRTGDERTGVTRDADIRRSFLEKAREHYLAGEATVAKEYKEQVFRKSCSIATRAPGDEKLEGPDLFKSRRSSVLIFGTLNRMEDGQQYFIGTSSAFALSDDGVCAGNYHQFRSPDPSKPVAYESCYVMDMEGKVYPVEEVLAASKKDDLAIFRIACESGDLDPLPLGEDLPVGGGIHIISHPDGRFYRYDRGHINRTYYRPGTHSVRQSISCAFARGSSGGPVLDVYGNLAGIITGTQNIHYPGDQPIYQMTIREIIPVSSLKLLID